MGHAVMGQMGIGRLKVLVVDDDEMVANFMETIISRLDHFAEIAGGYQEALQKISGVDFDLVFVDVNLSDGDGIELIKEIRKIFPDISIVAMSGDSSREMEIRAREQRIIYFLIKPFEMKEVYSIVDHVLKRKRQSLHQEYHILTRLGARSMEEGTMLKLIDRESFELEVLKETKPVLLAYVWRDHKYSEVISVLKELSEIYEDILKVLLLDKNQNDFVQQRLEIMGDPTFIGFSGGEEKERLFGWTGRDALVSFVSLLVFRHSWITMN